MSFLAGALLAAANFLPATLGAQEKADTIELRFSIKESIEYANAHYYTVQKAKVEEGIADYRAKEVFGLGLPNVNGQVTLNNYLRIPFTLIPDIFNGRPDVFVPVQFGTKYNATAGVNFSQLLFDGEFFVGLKAAKTFRELSTKNTHLQRYQLAANVAKAYYAVLVARRNISTIDVNVSRLQKTLSEITAMNKQGVVEKLDVDRMTVTLTNLQVEQEKATALVNLTTALLKYQMGAPPQSRIILTDSLDESNLPDPFDPNIDYTRRPEYQLLQINRRLNELEISRLRAANLPRLMMSGLYSTTAYRSQFDFFNLEGQWFPTGLVGFQLTVPIFDGLQRHYRVKQARLRMRNTDLDINNLENAINLQVAQANIQYANNYKTLAIQRRNIELAKEVTRVTQIKYEAGIGTNLEVVNAEAEYLTAQNNYYRTLYELIISQIDLQYSLGTFQY